MHRITRMPRRLLTTLLIGSLTLSACERPSPMAAIPPDAPQVSLTELKIVRRILARATAAQKVEHLIDQNGGTMTFSGGHEIRFPAGALPGLTRIHATASGDSLKIKFGPSGLVFPDSALPVVTYTYTDNTGLTDDDAPRLRIVYMNDAGTILEELPTEFDTATKTVRARIRHFSTYAVGTN
jgi:hypothetical protein